MTVDSGTPSEDTGGLITDVRSLVRRNLLFTLIFSLAFTVLVAVLIAKSPARFESYGSVYSRGGGAKVSLESLIPMLGGGSDGDTGYMMAILNSRTHRMSILESLSAEDLNHFWRDVAEEDRSDRVALELLNEYILNLEPSGPQEPLTVKAITENPQLSYHLAKTSFELLLKRLDEDSQTELGTLSQEVEEQTAELEKADKELFELMERHNLIAPVETQAVQEFESLAEWTREKAILEAERRDLMARLRAPITLEIALEIKGRLSGVTARVHWLEARIAEYEHLTDRLPEAAKEFAVVKRKIEKHQRLAAEVGLRYEMARLNAKEGVRSYRVMDEPFLNEEANPKGLVLYALLAFVGSGVVAWGLVIVKEILA